MSRNHQFFIGGQNPDGHGARVLADFQFAQLVCPFVKLQTPVFAGRRPRRKNKGAF